MTLFALILANLIVMTASAVQTAVGIGFGLIAVPLLALIDIRLIPGPTLFVSLFLALTMTSVGRAAIDRKEMSRIFVGLVIGTVFGGLALAIAPAGLSAGAVRRHDLNGRCRQLAGSGG